MGLLALSTRPFPCLIRRCEFCSSILLCSVANGPRLFLNIFLSALFGGTIYFIYVYLIKTFFPSAVSKSRSGRKPAPKRKAAASSAGASSGGGSDSDRGATSGVSLQYDESWIPKGHLERPEARRAKSGTPKTRAK
jgi:hypothetical protein